MWRLLLASLVVLVWTHDSSPATSLKVGPLRTVVASGTAGDDGPTLTAFDQLHAVASDVLDFTGRSQSLVAGGAMLASSGDSAPTGGRYAMFLEPSINAAGDVAFAATLDGGSATHGLFLTADGQTSVLATSVANGPAPRAPDINGARQVAYRLGTGRLYLADGVTAQITRILSTGDTVPGGGTVRRFRDLALDEDGTIAFIAELTDLAPDGSSVGTLLLRRPDGNLVLVARTGGTSPAGGRTYGSLRRQTVGFAPGGLAVFSAPVGDATGVFAFDPGPATTRLVALTGDGADGEPLTGIGPFVAAGGGGNIFFEAVTAAGARLVRANGSILSLVPGLLPVPAPLFARHVTSTGRTVWTASGDATATELDGARSTVTPASSPFGAVVDVGEIAQNATGLLSYVLTRSAVYRTGAGAPTARLAMGDSVEGSTIRSLLAHAGTLDVEAMLVRDGQGRRLLVVRTAAGAPRVLVTEGIDVAGRGRFDLAGEVLDVVGRRVRFVSRASTRGSLGLFEVDVDTGVIDTLLEPGLPFPNGRRLTEMILAPTGAPAALLGGAFQDGQSAVVRVVGHRPQLLARAGQRIRGVTIDEVAPGGAGSVAGSRRAAAFVAELGDGRSALLSSAGTRPHAIVTEGRVVRGVGPLGEITGATAADGNLVAARLQVGSTGTDEALLVARGARLGVIARAGGVAPQGGSFAQVTGVTVRGRTVMVGVTIDGEGEHAAVLATDVR